MTFIRLIVFLCVWSQCVLTLTSAQNQNIKDETEKLHPVSKTKLEESWTVLVTKLAVVVAVCVALVILSAVGLWALCHFFPQHSAFDVDKTQASKTNTSITSSRKGGKSKKVHPEEPKHLPRVTSSVFKRAVPVTKEILLQRQIERERAKEKMDATGSESQNAKKKSGLNGNGSEKATVAVSKKIPNMGTAQVLAKQQRQAESPEPGQMSVTENQDGTKVFSIQTKTRETVTKTETPSTTVIQIENQTEKLTAERKKDGSSYIEIEKDGVLYYGTSDRKREQKPTDPKNTDDKN